MDLLLTHGYFLCEDAKEQRIMKPYAPLGLLYLSSHLRRKGFDVEIYDSTFGNMDELSGILDAGPPSVVGIYGNLMTRANVLRIAAAARAAGWMVILGGPEPASYADEYLRRGADAIVQGEGEVPLAEFLAALRCDGRSSRSRVPGIAYLDGKSVVRTESPPLLSDLDGQPWPDRDRIDLARYVKVWRDHHGSGSLSLITARGCPYRCRWCSHATFGFTHRRRSVTGVVDEIEWLVTRYQPDLLWIADDVFTIHRSWMLQYAAEMKRRGLRIPFECITRADRVDPAIAEALAELGCFRVWIGSESGSQRILDAMQRGVTVAQVREAIHLCRERGIQTGMFLMWGYEGEEIEDIEVTVAHVKDCLPDVFLTTVSYPIKGTPYYDEVASRIVRPDAWERSTDREAALRGRGSREYYSFADQLLQAEMALHKSSDVDGPLALELAGKISRARDGLHRRAGGIEQ
jgi:radical SAM superfamily enzyme YgiQ (UPF0313 family)